MKKNIFTIVVLLLQCPLFGQVGKSKVPAGDTQAEANTPHVFNYACPQAAYLPPEFKQVTEQVLVKEASKRLEIVPAVYQAVVEQVLVSPQHASNDVMETVTEQILVKEAQKVLTAIPPIFETVTEQILEKESVTIPFNFAGTKQNVIIPNRYKTITKQVLKTPARIIESSISAEYKTITIQRIKTAAPQTKGGSDINVKIIPAEYKQITKQILKTPFSIKEIDVPAEYLTITKFVMAKNFIPTNCPSICDKDLSPKLIANLYAAIQKKGYNIPTETTLSLNFWKNMVLFQYDKGLTIGILDEKSMQALFN